MIAGSLLFNIFNKRLKKSETEDFKSINPYLFNGCGALLKKATIKDVGFYDGSYFIYYNEIDYSIRTYQEGYKIIYCYNYIVIHNQSPIGRPDSTDIPYLSPFTYENYFRGHLIFLFKHFNRKYFLLYGSNFSPYFPNSVL